MTEKKMTYPFADLLAVYSNHPFVKSLNERIGQKRRNSPVITTEDTTKTIENELQNQSISQPVQQTAMPKMLSGQMIKGLKTRIDSFKRRSSPTETVDGQGLPQRPRLFSQEPVKEETHEQRLKRKDLEKAERENRGMAL